MVCNITCGIMLCYNTNTILRKTAAQQVKSTCVHSKHGRTVNLRKNVYDINWVIDRHILQFCLTKEQRQRLFKNYVDALNTHFTVRALLTKHYTYHISGSVFGFISNRYLHTVIIPELMVLITSLCLGSLGVISAIATDNCTSCKTHKPEVDLDKVELRLSNDGQTSGSG